MNAFLFTLAVFLSWASTNPPAITPALECVFEHPRYVGSCVEAVTPRDDQTHLQACQAIIACLNNPQCVTSYCQATTLRGGWTLVSPKPDPPSPEQQ
jgi:hypothetical protein